jgi:hypothetical protein
MSNSIKKALESIAPDRTAKSETDPSLKPPKKWWNQKVKEVKSGNPSYDAETVDKTVGKIWSDLSDSEKSSIRGREGKTYGPAKESSLKNIVGDSKYMPIRKALYDFESDGKGAYLTGRHLPQEYAGEEWAERGSLYGKPVIIYYYFDDNEVYGGPEGDLTPLAYPWDAKHVTAITDMKGNNLVQPLGPKTAYGNKESHLRIALPITPPNLNNPNEVMLQVSKRTEIEAQEAAEEFKREYGAKRTRVAPKAGGGYIVYMYFDRDQLAPEDFENITKESHLRSAIKAIGQEGEDEATPWREGSPTLDHIEVILDPIYGPYAEAYIDDPDNPVGEFEFTIVDSTDEDDELVEIPRNISQEALEAAIDKALRSLKEKLQANGIDLSNFDEEAKKAKAKPTKQASRKQAAEDENIIYGVDEKNNIVYYKEFPTGSRFPDNVVQYLYKLAVGKGKGDSLGDVNYGMYYKLAFDPPLRIAEDQQNITPETNAILNDRRDGTVQCQYYDSEADADRVWAEIERQYEQFLAAQGIGD